MYRKKKLTKRGELPVLEQQDLMLLNSRQYQVKNCLQLKDLMILNSRQYQVKNCLQ